MKNFPAALHQAVMAACVCLHASVVTLPYLLRGLQLSLGAKALLPIKVMMQWGGGDKQGSLLNCVGLFKHILPLTDTAIICRHALQVKQEATGDSGLPGERFDG